MSNPDGFCFNHFISRVHLDGVFQATSGCHNGQSSQTHGLHLNQTARFPPTKMKMMGVVRRINKEEIGLTSTPLLAKALSRILFFFRGCCFLILPEKWFMINMSKHIFFRVLLWEAGKSRFQQFGAWLCEKSILIVTCMANRVEWLLNHCSLSLWRRTGVSV